MSKQNYYEILGVDKKVDEKTLKSAFRKKAMQYHPDKNPDNPEAEKHFKELNEAYSILSDNQKRAAYDQMGHQAFAQNYGRSGEFHDFGDIFSQIFGSGASGGFADIFGGQTRTRQKHGTDLRYELEISLEQAFSGLTKTINLPIAENCSECHGSGAAKNAGLQTCNQCRGSGRVRTQQGFFTMERPCNQCGGQGQYVADPCRSCDGVGQKRIQKKTDVNIPAGVEDGTRMRLSGQGDAAHSRHGGGKRGDLYLVLSVKPHDLFERDGADLFCRTPVPMTIATLGGEIEIPTIDGGRTKIKIVEGVQSGKRMRLRGKGMPILRTGHRGDMYVEVYVETPTRLNARQKTLLQEFAQLGGDHVNPQSHSFFEKAKKFWN